MQFLFYEIVYVHQTQLNKGNIMQAHTLFRYFFIFSFTSILIFSVFAPAFIVPATAVLVFTLCGLSFALFPEKRTEFQAQAAVYSAAAVVVAAASTFLVGATAAVVIGATIAAAFILSRCFNPAKNGGVA